MSTPVDTRTSGDVYSLRRGAVHGRARRNRPVCDSANRRGLVHRLVAPEAIPS